MKILSIDVGMKNLAYCLFHIQDNLDLKSLLYDNCVRAYVRTLGYAWYTYKSC